jgi:NurA-like 5'-3' nuclease
MMTAVEWVLEQFETINTQRKWKEIIEQAKEMEKQQIIDAMDVTQRTDFYVKYEGSEHYYNETFKTKQQ